jgi:conjugative transfer signal peptidase TraF
VALAGAAGLIGAALAQVAGARINTTRSIPVGLYWVSGAPADKGAYVLVCPPPAAVFEQARERGYLGAGYCPGGYGYLMKRIVATEGDVVAVSGEGVWVNGALLPASAPRTVDAGGRALPRFRTDAHTLGAADVLLMSAGRPTAFDARYFGPLPRGQIQTVVSPLLTW